MMSSSSSAAAISLLLALSAVRAFSLRAFEFAIFAAILAAVERSRGDRFFCRIFQSAPVLELLD